VAAHADIGAVRVVLPVPGVRRPAGMCVDRLHRDIVEGAAPAFLTGVKGNCPAPRS